MQWQVVVPSFPFTAAGSQSEGQLVGWMQETGKRHKLLQLPPSSTGAQVRPFASEPQGGPAICLPLKFAVLARLIVKALIVCKLNAAIKLDQNVLKP